MIALPDTMFGNADLLEGIYGFEFDADYYLEDSDALLSAPFNSLDEAVLLLTMRFSGIWVISPDGTLVH